MEHRHGRRYSIDLDVMLNDQTRLRSPGRLVCASLSGALVTTPLSLPMHGVVQLQFTTHDKALTRVHHLQAYVVRRLRGALALEWSQSDSQDVAALLANGRHAAGVAGTPVMGGTVSHSGTLT